MASSRSFTDYIKKKYYNDFYTVAEQFVEAHPKYMEGMARRLHSVGETEVCDVRVEHVWVSDRPDMEISFDVALSVCVEIHEGDYHYDSSVERTFWLMISCCGDLEKRLDDFKILQVSEYNGKNRVSKPLDDSLVPVISYADLERVAEDFLERNFPEALKITQVGHTPVLVDPAELARRLDLSIQRQRIKADASVFGQIYFADTDAEVYDEKLSTTITEHFDARTIVFDPQIFLLRNLGSVNNTIIHECVHWDKHRKAFMLEQLYNETASCISCEVAGGAVSGISKKATEFMEKQANQLAPRIQMPRAPFKAKAYEYIAAFLRETGADYEMDVMEQVIDQLSDDFGVSRQSAKIRLVELGFDGAIGAFNYVEGKHIRPHGFRKGSIQRNQTFTISAQDAAIQRLVNPELREKTKDGDYLFIENHYVYNAPLYVCSDMDGRLMLTDYARAHMDECCLVFDLSITGKVEQEYHTICILNRELSNVTFDVKFHNGYQNAPQERQVDMRKQQMMEWMDIRNQMTDNPKQCMELIFEWKGMKYTELGDLIERNPKTISRIAKGETDPDLKTAVRICFGLNLPPMISEKLLEVFGYKLKPYNLEHQWINEALHVKYPEPIWAVQEYLGQYGVEI